MENSPLIFPFVLLISALILLRTLALPYPHQQHQLNDEAYCNNIVNCPSPSSTVPTTTLLYSEFLTPTSPPPVPALFVIGDSSVDSGTNNFLGTFARADRPPYGRDFDTHRPTGRFSNGRIPVDFLGISSTSFVR